MHATAITFTHKLSFDEQRLLTSEQATAYCDWLLERKVGLGIDVNSEQYLQGDYDTHGSMQATEWAE